MNKNIGSAKCPESNDGRTRCEIWTRLSAMGYQRPVSNFNIGKKAEFAERKYFTESVIRHSMEDKLKEFKRVA